MNTEQVKYNNLSWKQRDTYHMLKRGIGDVCDVLLSSSGEMVAINRQSIDWAAKLHHYRQLGYKVVEG
jgi:hypothetical protein